MASTTPVTAGNTIVGNSGIVRAFQNAWGTSLQIQGLCGFVLVSQTFIGYIWLPDHKDIHVTYALTPSNGTAGSQGYVKCSGQGTSCSPRSGLTFTATDPTNQICTITTSSNSTITAVMWQEDNNLKNSKILPSQVPRIYKNGWGTSCNFQGLHGLIMDATTLYSVWTPNETRSYPIVSRWSQNLIKCYSPANGAGSGYTCTYSDGNKRSIIRNDDARNCTFTSTENTTVTFYMVGP